MAFPGTPVQMVVLDADTVIVDGGMVLPGPALTLVP